MPTAYDEVNMSKERELLNMWLCIVPFMIDPAYEKIRTLTDELLAQPEPEPTTDKQTSVSMAVMPNGVSVSNVYDAYEAGRASVMVESEPEPEDFLKEEKKAGRLFALKNELWVSCKNHKVGDGG
jgi:hypothetical protein